MATIIKDDVVKKIEVTTDEDWQLDAALACSIENGESCEACQ